MSPELTAPSHIEGRGGIVPLKMERASQFLHLNHYFFLRSSHNLYTLTVLEIQVVFAAKNLKGWTSKYCTELNKRYLYVGELI